MQRLKELPDNSVDAVVTDPPYGLSFMGKRWDYDVPSVEVWAECLRVLKPGGHLLAFAGTRTQHRMAVRIEDAGFEIRDMIAWVYGSGFPKSHNLKGEREGWGTALKPALEPITVARKPLSGTVAQNVQAWGTGAINVDGCRIGDGNDRTNGGAPTKNPAGSPSIGGGWVNDRERATGGRWPANLIHDGSDEVTELFPEGSFNKPTVWKREQGKHEATSYGLPTKPGGSIRTAFGDTGSAARFFYCAKASKRDRDEGCEGLSERAKKGAMTDSNWSGTERFDGNPLPIARNHHPTVKPTALMRYLCRLVTPPGGTVLDPFMGSGSTGKAAMLEGFQFIGIEREAEYLEIAEARIKHAESQCDMLTGQA